MAERKQHSKAMDIDVISESTGDSPSKLMNSSLDEAAFTIFVEPDTLRPEIEQILVTLKVDYDDPAFLVSWNLEAVALFVQAANLAAFPPPNFISTPVGQMTPTSLVGNIMSSLSVHGGGLHGNVLVAPNNIVEYGNILIVLSRDIEMHPFMQACMAQLPQGMTLGATFQISDRKAVTTAVPAARVPPAPPARPLFH
eukprot:c17413_g1_i1.p1 GENE.c17413_g1_i1~~c17413_g1_i1.p1  ORF type:complete len:205 (-),score=36.86 c17413_g1_i1:22-612(-)